jgi:hypothetical protein
LFPIVLLFIAHIEIIGTDVSIISPSSPSSSTYVGCYRNHLSCQCSLSSHAYCSGRRSGGGGTPDTIDRKLPNRRRCRGVGLFDSLLFNGYVLLQNTKKQQNQMNLHSVVVCFSASPSSSSSSKNKKIKCKHCIARHRHQHHCRRINA